MEEMKKYEVMDQLLIETYDFQPEMDSLDFSKSEITNFCRGCLRFEDEGSLKNLINIESPLTELYEQLTTSKIISSNIPSKMCFNCIQKLSKTHEFIDMLRHSYEILTKSVEKIEYLKINPNINSQKYNLEMRKIFQDILKEKCSYKSFRHLADVPASGTKIEQSFSDNENNESVYNHSSSSDDEIPLAERFSVDVKKFKSSKSNKRVKKKSDRAKKYITEKTLNNELIYNDCSEKEDCKYICFICYKEARNLNKHIEVVHHVDWPNAKCLKCSYTNFDKDALREHCHTCYSEQENINNTYPNNQNDFKSECNYEMSNCDDYFEQETEDRGNSKDSDDEFLEVGGDNANKKRGRPPKHRNKKYKYECNKCEEGGYENYEEIESHLKLKHGSESSCILCSKKYSNSFSLLYHMMVKHGKMKCCRLCLVSFRNSKELNEHYKSEEHNTKCTVCGEQFKNRKALYEHRRKKHLNPQLENQKYKCPECPKEFSNQNNIQRHILVAHYDLRFLCDTCGQSYTTQRNLKLHIQKFHEGVQVETKKTKKNFFCEACGRELKIFHKYAIAMHRAKHKGHNYVCRKCYETFGTEESFKKHVEDLGHQLFECHKCQSQFVREENFKIHLKNHDVPGWNKNMFATWGKSAKLRNEKGEFVCSYCPKVFKDKQRLDNHVRVHTNERPYKCHICAKGFKTWIHRKTHLNIHLGIKKWVCKYCSKAFTNSCTLKGHEMTHTGERPHRCPECKKGFITVSAMKKHRLVHLRSADSAYNKKATKLTKNEDQRENEVEENAEFVYKYGPMFTGSELSYEGFTEPQKVEPVGMVSMDKDMAC